MLVPSIHCYHQKQPLEVFCKKWCSYKFCKIHRKTPVPESIFNKFAGLTAFGLQLYLKRDSSTDFFLWILGSFEEHLFNRTHLYYCRSSRPKVFCVKGVLRNFTKFTGKHLCQSLCFNKVAGLRPEACNFIKKETLTQEFSYEFCKIPKNTFS